MPHVKRITSLSSTKPDLITIKARSSFSKTFIKVFKAHQTNIVVVQKPSKAQMTAVLLNRLAGKKFVWMQNFTNPPVPDAFAQFLLSQSDKIIVHSISDSHKLKRFGIPKNKIRYQK